MTGTRSHSKVVVAFGIEPVNPDSWAMPGTGVHCLMLLPLWVNSHPRVEIRNLLHRS